MEQANYQRDLLNQAGLDMMNMCIDQFEKATEAFINHDSDLAEEVIYKENRVNALDIKIEKDCERFIALYNPVAVDLRFVMAILKINIDLERIADHAFGISKYVNEDEDPVPTDLLKAVNFPKMIDTINLMFENILDAYENENIKAARKVFKKDKVLDKLNAKAFEVVEAEIKKDTSITQKALITLAVVKKFERVGDLAKNIAEEIIFYHEAEILKHKKKKK